MRKIKVTTWNERRTDEETGEVIIGKTSIINVFKTLILTQDPRNTPKGIDQFRTFNRIGKAFEKAEKSKKLELDEGDYLFLKGMVEKDIPRTWGMVSELSDAIEEFLEAKKVEEKKGKK